MIKFFRQTVVEGHYFGFQQNDEPIRWIGTICDTYSTAKENCLSGEKVRKIRGNKVISGGYWAREDLKCDLIDGDYPFTENMDPLTEAEEIAVRFIPLAIRKDVKAIIIQGENDDARSTIYTGKAN